MMPPKCGIETVVPFSASVSVQEISVVMMGEGVVTMGEGVSAMLDKG